MQRAHARFPALREVWIENGRFVSEASTALAVRVLDVKERDECRYLICDGGRTNHALAADARPIRCWLMPERHGRERLTTICGPTCMTDDPSWAAGLCRSPIDRGDRDRLARRRGVSPAMGDAVFTRTLRRRLVRPGTISLTIRPAAVAAFTLVNELCHESV